MKGKFQHQLEKLVLHKIIVLISVGVVMFLLGMMAITYYANEHNARNNMDMLCRSFEEAYRSSEEFLMNEAVQEACFKAITGKQDVAGGNGGPALLGRVAENKTALLDKWNELFAK